MAEKFDPWSLYKLKPTGQRVVILGFQDLPKVTVKVAVLRKFNDGIERDVFGIDPRDLVPCAIPKFAADGLNPFHHPERVSITAH